MGRKSIKATRQQEIIAVFYKLAKKEGLENTSLAKIGKAMDIHPSLIIHYFQTREELIYGLIDFILDKYSRIFNVPNQKAKTAREVLAEVIDNLFSKKWNKLFDDGLFYECYALTFREDAVKSRYQGLLDGLRSRLARLIEDCIREGSIETRDAREAADLIFILLDGAYFYLSLVTDPEVIEARLAFYKQQALGFLHPSRKAGDSRPSPFLVKTSGTVSYE